MELGVPGVGELRLIHPSDAHPHEHFGVTGTRSGNAEAAVFPVGLAIAVHVAQGRETAVEGGETSSMT